MLRTRFMTGGLAAVAVASAITLSAPAARAESADSADSRACGLPAVAAVYDTVVVDPVYRTDPAVTHTEWRWARDFDVYEFEFTRTNSAARVETDWSRSVPGAPEFRFERVVVDTPAVPAVPGTPESGHQETFVVTPAVTATEAEYEHEITGNLRWERDDWGAQNGQGKGWKKTGNTRQVEVTPEVTGERWVVDVPAVPGTPAIDAITHVESQWATTSPGGDWTGPLDERPGPSVPEQQTTDGSAPAGDGWALDATRSFAEVTDTVWATTAPEGFAPTGAHRVSGSEHVETDFTSATPPLGLGWYPVDGSATIVTDTEAEKVLVTPASVEQVLLSPALPATAPCEDGDVSGPQGAPAAGETAVPEAEVATVLPNTGGAPRWMAPAGLAAMFAGALLVRATRRRADLI